MAMRSIVSVSSIFVLGCTLLSTGQSASAAFGTPSWTRPADTTAAATDKTTYQAWNLFSDDDINTLAIEDGAPDVANINPNGPATVFEPGNGFLTGGGNIYSPTGVLDVTVTIPGYTSVANKSTKFLIQIRTIGSELVRSNALIDPTPVYNFSGLELNGSPIASLPDFTYNEIVRGAGSQGQAVEHAFAFTLPTTASSYVFNYSPLSSSSSQDQIAIDTQVTVPEPAAMGLIGIVGLMALRRRRHH